MSRASGTLRRVCAVWLCVACAAAPISAFAQDEPAAGDDAARKNAEEAGRLYKIGLLQFEGQEFEAAAANFRRALELDPNPVLAYNVARAYENNGQQAEAKRYYEQALSLNPPDDVRQKCEAALVRLKRTQERLLDQQNTKPGAVVVNVDGGGAVFIDDAFVGQAPVNVEVAAGAHRVVVQRSGHDPFERQVEVAAGGQVVLDAVLEERFEVAPWVMWSGLGLMGGAAALAGLGASEAGAAQDAFDQAQQLEVQRDAARFEQLRADGESARDNSNLLYIGAGALGVAGASMVVLYLLFPQEELELPQSAGQLQLGFGSVGWSVQF